MDKEILQVVFQVLGAAVFFVFFVTAVIMGFAGAIEWLAVLVYIVLLMPITVAAALILVGMVMIISKNSAHISAYVALYLVLLVGTNAVVLFKWLM